MVAGISAAGLFGLLTASGSYPLVFAVGAGLCIAGAGTMFVGHFVIGRRLAAL